MIKISELSENIQSLAIMETLGKINTASTDEEIIKRIMLGEGRLFGEIMQRYNQRLYRTARAYKIPDADCDDLLQQSYINAYENLHQFRNDAKFSTWLTRIVINNCLMFKRRQQPIQDEISLQLENMIPLAEKFSTPDKKLMQKEMKQLLESAIEKLPDDYRTVYIMREIEDLNVKETADCLGLSESNVKIRLHRAKILLRAALENFFTKKDILEYGNARCAALTVKVMEKLNLN